MISKAWLNISFIRGVQKVQNDIAELLDQVLYKQNVKELHFELPEGLTREVYVQTVRKVLACVRHEAYAKI